MKQLKVIIWGKEIGRILWNADTRRSHFVYNPDPDVTIPDIAPLLSPARNRNLLLPVYGDDRPLYQGLPPFIADTLPDSWGNTLFDRWIKGNKIAANKVTPLYKLMFIGPRGMGALEYEPCADDLNHTRGVDIKSLYEMSLKVLEDRDSMTLDITDDLTLQALLAVGTSAGGRQMKAIIAINHDTREIRSGQSDSLPGFEYYILKFGDTSLPIAEIEYAFHNIAKAAGIEMEACRLLPVEGINHFITRRFDRKDGKKIHIQTLAAINPEARSYEDLVATCRELSISESEIEQLFARMVFNVMANNTDDHSKNFSFMLEEGGNWHMAPAYDITFIFNHNATGPNKEHRLSICGKTAGISRPDLLEFARHNDIKNSMRIIDRIALAISRFDEFADEAAIPGPWRSIIHKTLSDNLTAFGYIAPSEIQENIGHDSFGRFISSVAVSVNSKGIYVIEATIDGQRRRRFIRPDVHLYRDLCDTDIFSLSPAYKIKLVESLFPME